MRQLVGVATDLHGRELRVETEGDVVILGDGKQRWEFVKSYWDFSANEQGKGGIEQLVDLLNEVQ